MPSPTGFAYNRAQTGGDLRGSRGVHRLTARPLSWRARNAVMRLLGKRIVGFGFVLLSLTAGPAVAASSNLRLVDAVAERNWPLVRTLLKEGVDVNAARGDGSTALLWAAHWDD